MKQNKPENDPVVAVCGNVASIYGPQEESPRGSYRPLLGTKVFAHRGAALNYADEFENPPAKQGK